MTREIDVIVQAVAVGQMALSEENNAEVQGMYDQLLQQLQQVIADDEDARYALSSVQKKPDSVARQAVFREETERLHIAEHHEIVTLSGELLNKITSPQFGSINVSVGFMGTSYGNVVIGPSGTFYNVGIPGGTALSPESD